MNGRISWEELTKDTKTAFAQQVDNLSAATFSNIDENFGEYAGLIYDGAFSEHMESAEKKGLTGEEIDEKRANQIAKEFIEEDRIQEFNSNGLIENGNIQVYDFNAKIDDNGNNNNLTISIAKKGGHIVNMNYNREVKAEVISQDEANEKGKEFLNSRGISNMKATYYLKEGGIVTINYAYEQNGVTIYPDLIKVKVALDNGDTERTFTKAKISIEEAKSKLNKSLEITSEGMAIIPTEWKTEILCYEFKGKIDDTDFLVYTNVETGREENILVIIDTPNGILTQ